MCCLKRNTNFLFLCNENMRNEKVETLNYTLLRFNSYVLERVNKTALLYYRLDFKLNC